MLPHETRGSGLYPSRASGRGPTRRPSTLNWCTAGPHGETHASGSASRRTRALALVCGRFFLRNGAIGRLELRTMSGLCRRSTPMERGCA